MRVNYVKIAEIFDDIQASNNTRKPDQQPDDCLALNQIDAQS